jgi:hypothetical protein
MKKKDFRVQADQKLAGSDENNTHSYSLYLQLTISIKALFRGV